MEDNKSPVFTSMNKVGYLNCTGCTLSHIGRRYIGGKHVRMCACPRLDEGRKYIACRYCLYKNVTNIVHSHFLGISGMDLTSIRPSS